MTAHQHLEMLVAFWYNLDQPPGRPGPQESSHHQNYNLLLGTSQASQPKPLFATIASWDLKGRSKL